MFLTLRMMFRLLFLHKEANIPYSLELLFLVSALAVVKSNAFVGSSISCCSSFSKPESIALRYCISIQLQSRKALISSSVVLCSNSGGRLRSLDQSTELDPVGLPLGEGPAACEDTAAWAACAALDAALVASATSRSAAWNICGSTAAPSQTT